VPVREAGPALRAGLASAIRLRVDICSSLVGHTWIALFDGQPQEVLDACAALASLEPQYLGEFDTRIALVNWAHAQTLLGNDAQANQVYIAFADGDYGSEVRWPEVIVEDFRILRAAGYVHRNMDFILAIIGAPE